MSMRDIQCQRCGKTVMATGSQSKFCQECAQIHAKELRKSNYAEEQRIIPTEILCTKCGKTSMADRPKATVCSECRKERHRLVSRQRYSEDPEKFRTIAKNKWAAKSKGNKEVACKYCKKTLILPKSSRKSICDECKKRRTKEKKHKYYTDNKERINKRNNEYYHSLDVNSVQREKDRIRSRTEKSKARVAARRVEKRAQINETAAKIARRRRATDIVYKLRCQMSSTILLALKKAGGSKRGYSIMQYLPYTIEELKKHLESLFEPWMTWENHGKYDPKTWDDNNPTTWKWQLDHIEPQALLPYTSMEDDNFKKCWTLSNLQPLSAKANIKFGSRPKDKK